MTDTAVVRYAIVLFPDGPERKIYAVCETGLKDAMNELKSIRIAYPELAMSFKLERF